MHFSVIYVHVSVYAMKMYTGVEEYIHPLLTLAQDKAE